MTVVRIDGPYWRVSLNLDKKSYTRASYEYPTPVNVEYTYPDFITIGDTVVFKFFEKSGGFKLQIPNVGPFVYGQRYEFKGDERYFDAPPNAAASGGAAETIANPPIMDAVPAAISADSSPEGVLQFRKRTVWSG